MPRVLAFLLCVLSGQGIGLAFVGGASGGGPGDTTVEATTTLERGLIEPNENEDSWQDAKWNLFGLSVTHTFGSLGPLKDFFVRVGGLFYVSPAEKNERGPVDACGGVDLGGGNCQFHPKDKGGIASLSIGANFIHTAKIAFGFSLQGQVPFGVDLDKFANPRVDYISASLQLGVQLNSWLSFENNLYVGSGPFGPQNGQLAYTQLFGAKLESGGHQYGLRVGPYVDADITERTDEVYDESYTVGFPEVTDRIRMARFGMIVNPYVVLSKRVSARITYLQKFFGYDAPATQFFEFAVGVTF